MVTLRADFPDRPVPGFPQLCQSEIYDIICCGKLYDYAMENLYAYDTVSVVGEVLNWRYTANEKCIKVLEMQKVPPQTYTYNGITQIL